MNLISSASRHWIKSLTLVSTVLVLTGCSTGDLLVKKEEAVPIRILKVEFAQVMPNGDGSSSYVDISRELDKAGYSNGTLGVRFSASISEGFRESGVDAAIPGTHDHMGNIPYSHAFVVVPKSFGAQYRYGALQLVTINAEYQLYDLEKKQIVWKSMVSIPAAAGVYSKTFAKDPLLSWNKYGLIKLEESALQRLQ
jgi:hypothetical protein